MYRGTREDLILAVATDIPTWKMPDWLTLSEFQPHKSPQFPHRRYFAATLASPLVEEQVIFEMPIRPQCVSSKQFDETLNRIVVQAVRSAYQRLTAPLPADLSSCFKGSDNPIDVRA